MTEKTAIRASLCFNPCPLDLAGGQYVEIVDTYIDSDAYMDVND